MWSATLAGPGLTLVPDVNAAYVAIGLPGTQSSTAIAAYKATDGSAVWGQPVQDGYPSVVATADGNLIAAAFRLGNQGSGGIGTEVFEALRTSDGGVQWKVSVDGQLGGVAVAPFKPT